MGFFIIYTNVVVINPIKIPKIINKLLNYFIRLALFCFKKYLLMLQYFEILVSHDSLLG